MNLPPDCPACGLPLLRDEQGGFCLRCGAYSVERRMRWLDWALIGLGLAALALLLVALLWL